MENKTSGAYTYENNCESIHVQSLVFLGTSVLFSAVATLVYILKSYKHESCGKLERAIVVQNHFINVEGVPGLHVFT